MTKKPSPVVPGRLDSHMFWLALYPHLAEAKKKVLVEIGQNSGLPRPGTIHVVLSEAQHDPRIATFPAQRQIEIRLGVLLCETKEQLQSSPNQLRATKLWSDDSATRVGAASLRIAGGQFLLGIVGEDLALEHAVAILYLALHTCDLISSEELGPLGANNNTSFLALRA